MKVVPYSKALRDRRLAGERIGLLVVSVHDWKAGEDFDALPNVARLVVPPDGLPHEFDWSCAVALDCLVCGNGAAPVFYAAALMLMAARAASVWGLFDDGVWLLEPGSPQWYRHGLVATEGPIQQEKLAAVLRNYRERALLTRAGVYGTPMFDVARVALFDRIFGPLSAKAQAWVAEKQRISGRAA